MISPRRGTLIERRKGGRWLGGDRLASCKQKGGRRSGCQPRSEGGSWKEEGRTMDLRQKLTLLQLWGMDYIDWLCVLL